MTLPAPARVTPLARPTRRELPAHLEPPRLRQLTPTPPLGGVTPPPSAEPPAPSPLPRALDLAIAGRHPSCEGGGLPCPLQGTCPIRPTCTDDADHAGDAERTRSEVTPTVVPFARRDDRGQATVEYGLVILVAGVLALGVIAWARGTGAFTGLFQTVIDTLTGSI
jgi:hypothetical protein